MHKIVKILDNQRQEVYPATVSDAIIDIQEDGTAVKLPDILNAMIEESKEIVGIRNYARGTNTPFTVNGFSSISNNCFNIYKIDKEVTGGDVCLAFDIELTGCLFTSRSKIDIQADSNWDYNAGISGWGVIPVTNGKAHVFICGNIPQKTKDAFIQIRCDYVRGGTMKITNFIYSKGNKEVDWAPGLQDGFKQNVTYDLNRILTLSSSSTSSQIINAFTPIGESTMILPSIENHTLYDFKFESKNTFGTANIGFAGSLIGFTDYVADTSLLEMCIGYYQSSAMLLKLALIVSNGNYGVDYILTKNIF